MKLNKEGWFQDYIDFRGKNPPPSTLPTAGVKIFDDTGIHNESDQAIYYFLQPTGIFYGMPVAFPFADLEYPRSQYYDKEDRSLVTFLDSMVACLVADRHFLVTGLYDESDHFAPAVKILQEYYRYYPPEFRGRQSSPSKWFQPLKKKSYPYRIFEYEFRERLIVKSSFLKIRDPFANIFLFLDIFHCLTWQRRRLLDGAEVEDLSSQYSQQMLERETLLKLVISTVFADRVIDRDDRRLVERFFRASRLPSARLGPLRELLTRGIEIGTVEIPQIPWLVRRYFLSLVLMVTMLDRNISDEEERLLEKLTERLGLWREELDQSRAAMDGFLVNDGDRLQFHAHRPNLFSLSEVLAEKATIAIRLNLDRVVNEVRETHELYSLLMKSAKEPLTLEEKKKVRNQLTDILKTIPALAIFALPGGGVILPVLIRLLPFNLLPSSFDD